MLNFIDDARVHFRVCRMCGVEEQGGEEAATVSSSDCCTDKSDAPSPRSPQRLKLCRACQAVAYCSRECQMSHWKEHRPHCKLIKSMLDIHQSTVRFDVPKFIEEAFRHGTSVPLRRGKHGESFHPEARELGKAALEHTEAGRFDMAFSCYTKALESDKRNHLYYFRRGALCLNIAERHPAGTNHTFIAKLDAGNAIMLDRTFSEAWVVAVRAQIKNGKQSAARDMLNIALSRVPQSHRSTHRLLLQCQNGIEAMTSDNCSTATVYRMPEKYYYAHTVGRNTHSDFPDLIAFDLKISRTDRDDGGDFVADLRESAEKGTVILRQGEVILQEFPKGPDVWVFPIPVDLSVLESAEEVETVRCSIGNYFLVRPPVSEVIVLKIEYRKGPHPVGEPVRPPPLSKKDARNILLHLSHKSKNAGKLYTEGKRLI